VTDHFAYGEGFRRARQQVAAFGASAGFDKAALFEAGENQLQEFLGNFLAGGDVCDSHGLAGSLTGEVEDCLKRVFTFDGSGQSPISQ